MPKVILISQVPLPFSNIGSWTTLYRNYFQDTPTIDYLVCPEPEEKWDSVNYNFVANSLAVKVQKRIYKNPYVGYFKSLKKILQTDEKYIIQIVDNFGIVKPLVAFLNQIGLRKQVYLQFFYHGYPPFYENFQGRWFFETVDEMVLLTHSSYLAHKETYTVLPTRFSVLYNGIDTSRFFPLAASAKLELKTQKQVAGKTVFVWCSQDRPKKGLHLLLDAWQRIYTQRQDIILWVIGCEPKSPQDGVVYLGRIPNHELPAFLQASDCYLFPTLWHEGFGLSLIEALHCGNYCIASANGGVPEVLQNGKYGKLIVNPNFVTAWEEAMLEFLEAPLVFESLPTEMYSTESWNKGMNQIIKRAKQSMLL
jgi:L-malate glycosyltransferase